jgi:hypothetical protein
MRPPLATILRSAVLAIRWLPALGVLLTGLGGVLLYAGMAEPAPAVLPTDPTASRRWTDVPTTTQGIPPALSLGTPTDPGDRAWSGARRVGSGSQVRSPAPSVCLGPDLAAGRSTETAVRTPVALPLAGTCGDLRKALAEMLLTRGVRRDMDSATDPIEGVTLDPPPGGSIDYQAAALFGPPDRQPAAMLEDEELSGERGEARGYLEQTAWVHWLVPRTASPWQRG